MPIDTVLNIISKSTVAADVERRNRLACIQKILNEHCSDEYEAEAAYDKLNDILKFDEYSLRYGMRKQ